MAQNKPAERIIVTKGKAKERVQSSHDSKRLMSRPAAPHRRSSQLAIGSR